MDVPELTIVAGPNAAGKSSFIRSRISELEGCEVIMTDVYKNRTIKPNFIIPVKPAVR